ncbi:hypothetical protein C8J57DRAFT_1533028 [Mycena rebaudengoi]|nr:hypothetical protein C8J57DRAFT_1533028 [Mycena rebaudengoi]
MLPLTRQQTLESLRSWWSDSNLNLRGPTINIHAAAKPFMRLLYDRQALEFISTIHIPLSPKDAEIYGSYLLCKYVSASTKSAILEDIYQKSHSHPEALVVHTHILHDILQLLEGPVAIDTRMWKAIQPILRGLAERDATVAATCGSLVALLCDSDVPQVIDGALWALCCAPGIKFPPVTTGLSVEHYRWILEIVSKLVRHESTAVAVVEANILSSVKKLLRSHRTDLHQPIFSMLGSLALHKSTLMAVIRALPLDLLGTDQRKNPGTLSADLLEIWSENLVTTKLLDASHKATAEATCSSLVALVCDSDIPQVVDGALWALSRVPQLKFLPVTTGVSVEAKLLNHIVDMLKAPNTAKWRYPAIFRLLSHLARRESSAIAIVEASILNSVGNHLKCHSTDIYEHNFSILESLVSRESTATAMLDMHLYNPLAILWREDLHKILPSTPAARVIKLLACMARWREGAEGMVIAKLLKDVRKGLRAPHYWLRLPTCQLLRALVRHESTVQAVVAIVLREDVVARLSDWDDDVRKCAAETLRELDATLERINGISCK